MLLSTQHEMKLSLHEMIATQSLYEIRLDKYAPRKTRGAFHVIYNISFTIGEFHSANLFDEFHCN